MDTSSQSLKSRVGSRELLSFTEKPMKWVWIILALAYILSPYDLIPDFIPVRGWIDDIVVALLLGRYLYRYRGQPSGYRPAGGRQPPGDNGRREQRQEEAGRSHDPGTDPYTVLGLSPGASQEEIRAAYRKLANQYHPDKVTHLGKEFQKLAEQRFKEIQQAYQHLARRR